MIEDLKEKQESALILLELKDVTYRQTVEVFTQVEMVCFATRVVYCNTLKVQSLI